MKPILCFLLMMFTSLSASAEILTNLYEAELPVTSQSNEERTEAAKAGLVQVLIKLTGDARIQANPQMKTTINRAGYFINEFSYSSSSQDASHYLLHVRYEKEDLNRLLKTQGFAYWGENRPALLVWLVMENAKHAVEIISTEKDSEVLTSLQEVSKKYGLPLIFPRTLNEVSPVDVATFKVSRLQEAGKSYTAGGILIGKISSKERGFESQWQLNINNNETKWNWDIKDNSLDKLIDNAFNQVSLALVKQSNQTKSVSMLK